MDKFILKFVLFITKIFLKKEVDFEKLKIIAETKLMLDRRRIRVAMKNSLAKKDPSNQIFATLIVYCVLGLFVSLLIPMVKDIVISMTIIHSYVLFMMAMTLITDFSSVLLDTIDNQIVLPRPVSSKTFFVARLVHILVYLLQFTIAVALFPIILTFVTYGVFVGLASIFTILLTVLFSVFLTYLLYGLILKCSSEQRLKDVISGFQIVMTITFAIDFQIVPRLFDVDKMANFSMPIYWYTYFLPPLWMANLLQSVKTFSADMPHLIMILLAITIPFFTFWAMIKFLAPSFSKKIAALGNAGDETTSEEKNAAKNKIALSEKLSAFVCSNKTERAGFELAWKITCRDKNFKIQFYPSLAYILVFAFVFIFNKSKDYAATWQNLPNTNSFLWFVYLPMFTMSAALSLVAFNENFAASWVYFSRPLQKPGSLISGALKMLIVKFMLPIVLVLFSFAMYVWGYKIIDDFILGVLNNILIFIFLSHITKSYLPFSMQPNVKQQTGKFIQVILQMVIIGILVGLHYLALKIWWLVAALIPLSAVGCYFIFSTIQNYSWQKIAT